MSIKNICDIVFKLYLYADSTKLIHYSTDSNHTHELCDQVRDTIIEFADELAEQTFGVYGKPSYNSFTPINKLSIIEEDNLPDICKHASEMVDSVKTFFNSNKKMSGTVSLIDDFKGELNKLIFLSTFDKKTK